MPIPKEIFKSYDIRALHDEITDEVATKVGYFVAKNTDAKDIVVGRDMRDSSDRIAGAVILGIQKAGSRAIDIGLCTTSFFNYAVSEKYSSGLMVTASHNPSEYNGIKVMSGGVPVSGHDLFSLIVGEVQESSVLGGVEKIDFLQEYLEFCLQKADVQNLNFKFVIDYGNGMASTTIQPLLRLLKIEAEELYAQPDSGFPNHEANPAKIETMQKLQEEVVASGAAFGVAFDGDADRIAFVDEKGGLVPGDHMLGIYAQYFMQKEGGGYVIGAPNQGQAVRELVNSLGGKYIDVPIGRTNTINGVKEHDAVIGGELAFHTMFRDMNGLESVDYALLLMMKILQKSGKTMSELAGPLRNWFNSGEINIKTENKELAMKKIEEAFASSAKSVSRLDGIRCDFTEGWWFIVRASNTEPVLRLTVEGKDADIVKQKAKEISELMK
ncbi:phosphomannomutase/phosphoglucomutase [Patescibacteria group bacterium]|nr:phosphomannomutase/phosphoglucomutase [Patescibacteria group bacterium]